MKTLEERISHRIQVQNECRVWTGGKDSSGYGEIKINGKQRGIHRFIWESIYGTIPNGMLVCHACDNPPCIRSSHLFLGSPKQNSQDCINKGRTDKGKKRHSYNAGIQNGRCKKKEGIMTI